MNVVLAVAVLTGLFMVSYEKILNQGGAVVGHVVPDSPAAKAGVQVGDKIVRLDGKDNPDWEEIVTRELESAQRPMTVTLERAGHRVPITVTPVLDDKEGVGSAGWEGQNEIRGLRQPRISGTDRRSEEGRPAGQEQRYSKSLALHITGSNPQEWRQAGDHRIRSRRCSPYDDDHPDLQESGWNFPLDDRCANRYEAGYPEDPAFFSDALHESLVQNGKNASLIVEFLRGILERRMSAKNISGPIGIAHYATEAAQEGPSAFLMLMSVVSLNLAIVNLLPIPILDGGAILTLLIETVMGRDLSLNVKEALLKVGFVFLMMLMVFVIYNDIAKRFTPGLLITAGQSVLQKR